MEYSWWDFFKDLLGAIGPIFISVPWFSDFSQRRRAKDISGAPFYGKASLRLKRELEEYLRDKIQSPKASDFAWTLLGLLCIAASFFYTTYPRYPGLTPLRTFLVDLTSKHVS